MSLRQTLFRALALTAALPAIAFSQEDGPRTRYVLSIGHHPRVDGLRINFRDRELDLVRGINLTLWQPYDGAELGTVKGLALGLPMTGSGDITGAGIGVIGVGAYDEARGLMLGGVGVGSGGDITGITVGGIGAGAGGTVGGLAIGGIGVGAGGDIRGIALGGIGAGVGGDIRGFAFGGIGAAAGGAVRGIVIGGVGVGAGGSIRGAAIGGVGVGTGGDLRGLAIGGVGVGAGGELVGLMIGGAGVGAGGRIHGVAIGAGGVGSPRIDGVAVGSYVRATESKALIIAPLLFRSFEDADIGAISISGVGVTHGNYRGVALSVVNFAESLDGVQLGLINIVRDNPSGRRVLPIINWGDGR